MKRVAVLAALVVGTAAHADDPARGAASGEGLLHRLAAEVRARLDEASAARIPKLVPPVKLELKWKLQKIGSIDLGAPLVALAAADLDGDGRAELYAVTPRDVIAIGLDRRVRELGRVAFAGEPAVPTPRDVVGTAVRDGEAIVASTSSWARELRVGWRNKALVADPGAPGFEPCPGERAQLVPGRNFFAGNLYGVRCRADLVDVEGHPLRLRAELSTAGKLSISMEKCAAGGAECKAAGRFEYGRVGVAFELADVDRDGTPELVFAGAGAPGDPDELVIVSLGDDEKHHKLKKLFAAGGVAGIAVGDFDGGGTPDVVAAVRLVGATRVDLWRLF